MLTCQDISKLLSQSLDTNLSWKQRLKIKLHLFICSMCRKYWKQLQNIELCMSIYYAKVMNEYSTCFSQESKNKIQKAMNEQI